MRIDDSDRHYYIEIAGNYASAHMHAAVPRLIDRSYTAESFSAQLNHTLTGAVRNRPSLLPVVLSYSKQEGLAVASIARNVVV